MKKRILMTQMMVNLNHCLGLFWALDCMGSRRVMSRALQAAAAAVLMVDVFSACRCYFHGVVTVNGGCGW